MNERPLTLREGIRRHVAAAEAALEHHPEPSTWVAYSRRELPPADMTALARHLAVCSACSEVVLDFEVFDTDDEEAPSEERDEAWHQAAEAAPAGGVVVPLSRKPRGAWRRLPQLWPAAASLAAGLALSVLTYQVGLSRQSETPRENVPLFDLRAVGSARDGGGSVTELRLPEGAGSALLILNPQEQPSGERFTARLVSEDGRLLWSSTRLAPVVGQAFTVELPRGFLAPGRYRLELVGIGDDTEAPLGTFLLVVSDP